MSPEEFEQMLEDFITREEDDMNISTFFEVLALIDQEKRAAAPVIKLEGELVSGQLVFSPPTDQTLPITVQGNEIVLPDGSRIILTLKSSERMAA
jgi:hypothetical protein